MTRRCWFPLRSERHLADRQAANAALLKLAMPEYLALPRRERRRRVKAAREVPSEDLRTRRNVQWFCAACVVSEGETHLEWCHRSGVMVHEATDG